MFVKNLSSFKLGDKFDKFNYFDTCCEVASLNTGTCRSGTPVTSGTHRTQIAIVPWGLKNTTFLK